MAVSLSNTTPAAPAGSQNVTWQSDGAGNVSAYVSTAVELVADGFDATAQAANIASTNLIASPTAGRYRVSVYEIVTQAATTSSTLPSIVLSWTDVDGVTAQTFTVTPTSPTGNSLTTLVTQEAILNVAASAPLAFSTTGYASVGGVAMQYAIHIRVEALD